MSNNCLVTKLKTSIDDNQLPVLGAFDIIIPCNGNQVFFKQDTTSSRIISSTTMTIKAIGGYFIDGNGVNLGDEAHETDLYTTAYKGVYGEGNVILKFKDDYNINLIFWVNNGDLDTKFDLNSLSYRNNLSDIVVYSLFGGHFYSKGNVDNFKNNTNVIDHFSVEEKNDGDIIGDIKNIPSCKMFYSKFSSIGGKIEDYLKRHKDSITETIKFADAMPKNVTLNDVKYNNNSVNITPNHTSGSNIYTFTFTFSGGAFVITATYNSTSDTWTYQNN